MKINVTKSDLPSYKEYCEEIRKFWDSHWLTNMGEEHNKLELNLKKYLDCNNLVLYTNGHLALENIITAMNFPANSEIITTPFTFASTTHAIVRNGFIPVFCDINEEDYTIDVNKIESLVTDRTVAILPVHVYGNMCNVEKIEEIAQKYNLKVIYDAAHAFAVKYKGVSSANFGDATMFSFHATKVFNTIEGGAVCFKDTQLTSILNDLKNFGIRGPESVDFIGGNAKMNEFQAAMGVCNLRHLDLSIEKRKIIVKRYRENLNNINGIKLCPENNNVQSNYSYFPVVFDGYKKDRNEICRILAENNIYARKYFYPLTNTFKCYSNLQTAIRNKTPIAEHISNRVLTLPLYPDLDLKIVDKICSIINS